MADEEEKSNATEQPAPDAPEQPAHNATDIESDEKKEKKVMLEDEEDLDHEVTHSDEQTADTDVKKVTKSQRKLWVLVGVAAIMLIFGGVMFYSQLEGDSEIAIGADGSTEDMIEANKDDTPDLLPRGTFAFAISPGNSAYKRHNIDDKSDTDIDVGGNLTSGSETLVFQLSSDSLVSATLTSGGIIVKNLEGQQTILADKASSIKQWVLSPDGTKIFVMVGSSLHSYSSGTGEGGEIALDFAPSGSERSNLYFSRDGSVRQYAKTGGKLTGSIYRLVDDEVERVEHDVIRLANMGPFRQNSLSPDGSSLLFVADINGVQTLQLLSLNSLVLRTVYLASAGNVPAEFAWSDDSNNVFVYESGSSPLAANLKVGILEREVLKDGVIGVSSLGWSPTKRFASYISRGTMKAVDLETKEVTDVISSLQAGSVAGWFRN